MNLHDYDLIIINSSGGKDSQTMLRYVFLLAQDQDFPMNRIVVAHADLGRMEWEGTADLAQTQAEWYGLRFEKVARPQGDLLTHIEQRGMWPDSQNRYCTSDHKRGQVQKIITMLGREIKEETGIGTQERPLNVLNCMGLRAEESPARAKQPVMKFEPARSTKSRKVWTWLPILDWKEYEVWADIHASGVPYHQAYDLGMPRLSCIFCIFAPKAALVLAGKHNPELLREYVEVEEKINHKFRLDTSLKDVQDAVQVGDLVGALDGKWNM